MTVLASRAAILRVHLATRLAGIIHPKERVRERALHGEKVTQPTDIRRARLPLSAVPGLYIEHPARTRKGGRKDPTRSGFQVLTSLGRCHGRHGSLLDAMRDFGEAFTAR